MDDSRLRRLIARARAGDEAAIGAAPGPVRGRGPDDGPGPPPADRCGISGSTRWTSSRRSGRASSPAGEAVGSFADAGQFRGYLAGVARNKVYEEHRRLTRTRKYDLAREERLYVRKGERDVPLEVAAVRPSPSENVQARDRLGQLVRGGRREEAEVVELRRQGLTFGEIAGRLGIHERSVRRVIDAIRERMERMEARRWR